MDNDARERPSSSADGGPQAEPDEKPMSEAAVALGSDVIGHVRQDDIEPYTGLRWVGTVFKAAAIFLLVALVGEFIAGIRAAGLANLPYLLGETARTFVFMVVLWGGGDLVRLLVDVGHDIRAQRIFLTRLEWRSREEDARRERSRERRRKRREQRERAERASRHRPAAAREGATSSAPRGPGP